MQSLLPAHAGVIPDEEYYNEICKPTPRTCGGDPPNFLLYHERHFYSPHMRG